MIINIIGSIGVILIITTYFLLQIDKIDVKSKKYSLLNILGSSLIIYSLIYNWNLASFLIEFFWIIISIIGLIKHNYLKNN